MTAFISQRRTSRNRQLLFTANEVNLNTTV